MSMQQRKQGFNPSAQITSSMSQMKSFGFAANKIPQRSSIVMNAGPTISGETDNSKDVEMSFFDEKFGNPVSRNNPFY